MNLSETARALLRDCERLARRATANEYAEAHVHLWLDGVFVAVALDIGGAIFRNRPEEASGESRAAFAEGYGKTPHQALIALQRVLRQKIDDGLAWPSATTACIRGIDSARGRTV